MKHINEYMKDDVVYSINESQLFINRGAAIDSLIYKMNKNIQGYTTGAINESNDDVLLTFDEQLAAKDIIQIMCNKYIDSLNEEAAHINEQLAELDNQIITEGITDVIKKSKDTLKKVFDTVGKKIAEVKTFIATVLKSAMQSIKDFCLNITNMFIQFGCSFAELLEKFKLSKIGDPEKQYMDMAKDILANKDYVKSLADKKLFESYGIELSEGLFSKDKKEKPDDGGDIYAAAFNADEQKSQHKFLKMVLQIFISYGLTTVLPALLMFIPGIGEAAGLIQIIIKLLWAGKSIYSLLKNFLETIKSPDWKRKKKLTKVAYGIFMIGMLIMTLYTAGKAVSEAKKAIDLIKELGTEALKHISPDASVLALAKKLNKLFDSDTATENIKNFGNIGKELITTTEKTEYHEVSRAEGQETFDKVLQDQVKNKRPASGFVQDVMDKKDEILKGLPHSDHNFVTNIRYDGGTPAFARAFEEELRKMGMSDSTIKLLQQHASAGDKIASAAGSGRARQWGAIYQNLSPKDMEILQNVAKAQHISFSFGDLGASAGMIKTVVSTTIKTVVNGMRNSIPLPMMSGYADKMGEFAMRLGSNRTKNLIYDIEETREVTMARLKEMCEDAAKQYNESLEDNEDDYLFEDEGEEQGKTESMPVASNMYETMKKQLNDNYAKVKAALESDEIKNDPKLKKELEKLKEEMGENVEDCKVLVFYGRLSDKYNKKKKAKTDEPKEESLDTDEEVLIEGLSDDEILMLEGIKDSKLGKWLHKKIHGDEEEPKQDEPKEEPKQDEPKQDEPKEDEPKEDDKKEANDLIPVFFINPMLMCCGDLAKSANRKGRRAWRRKVYFLKGLFARLEFFPVDGGMSLSKLGSMFNDIIRDSMKACWNMCGVNKPCIKDPEAEDPKKAKFVVVDDKDSKNPKDKKRVDFGNFTNEEITEIMNNPDSITKYYDGTFADAIGGQQIVGKTDNEKNKAHTQKVHDEIKNQLETNDELKSYIKDHEKLCSVIYKDGDADAAKIPDEIIDEITDLMDRTNEIQFKAGDQGFMSKVKKFFKGDDEKGEAQKLIDKANPKDLEKLVYLLHKNIKKKHESLTLPEYMHIVNETKYMKSFAAYLAEHKN